MLSRGERRCNCVALYEFKGHGACICVRSKVTVVGVVFNVTPIWNNTAKTFWIAIVQAKMNLEKVNEEEKRAISRKYFIGGFFLLPLLWLVNSVWMFREAFKKNGDQLIRRYVAGSIIGTVCWIGLFVLWVSVYQTQRVNWGAFGDYISLTPPYGMR